MTPCSFASKVTAHFAHHNSLQEDRALFAHLPTCPTCTAHYQRASMLEAATRPDDARQARLGAALGFSAPRRARWPAWAAVAGAAALVVALVLARGPSNDASFQARGDSRQAAPTLGVYRVQADGAQRVGPSVHAADRLAFDYTNPRGAKYLLVFARTKKGEVFWYFPAWADDSQNPAAVPIQPGATTHELTEQVVHDLPVGALAVVAVFTDERLTVRQAEARLAAGGVEALGGEVVTRTLEVEP